MSKGHQFGFEVETGVLLQYSHREDALGYVCAFVVIDRMLSMRFCRLKCCFDAIFASRSGSRLWFDFWRHRSHVFDAILSLK
jgi:hypothetical protein